MFALRPTLPALVLLGTLGVLLPYVGPARAEEEPAPVAAPAFWLAKAEAISKRIEHSEGRAALLVSIGTGWVEAGELERARPLLAAAVRYGERCRGCISKARRLAEVAVLQHRAGDEMGSGRTFEIAEEACEELDGARRAQSLAYLALQREVAGEAMVARPLFADAAQAADALEGWERAEALAAVADAEAAAGHVGEAGRLRTRLAVAVRGLGEDAVAILASTQLTAATAEMAAGRLDAAERLLAEVRLLPLAVSGYATLARARFRAGAAEATTAALVEALRGAEKIAGPVERADAFAEIARAAWAVRADTQGRAACAGLGKASGEIEDLEARFEAQVAWADLFRVAGDSELLARSIGQLEELLADAPVDGSTKNRLRGLLAGLEARSGRFGEAERGAQKIEDPVRRARARLDLADAHREAGTWAAALGLTTSVLGSAATWDDAERAGDRGEVRRRAAVLQAACGRPADAAKTVDEIESPFHAATACTYIARDLT